MMKIALLNSVCYGSTGRITCGIARRLQAQGHEARIYFGRETGPSDVPCFRTQAPASIKSHALAARLSDRQGFFSKSATRELVQQLSDFQPDVIHLHNLHGYWLDLETLFSALGVLKTPVVWTLHDCWAFTGHCAYFDMAGCSRWKQGCGSCPQKKAYPASLFLDQSARNFQDKKRLYGQFPNLTVVTPSHWLEGLVKQSILGNAHTAVLPNGVDTAVFHPTPGTLRAQYGLEGKTLLLGVTNIWEPRKGLSTFFSLRKQLDASYAMVLIGLSPQQLRTLPAGIIGLPRTANPQELAAWYTTADVLVDPTREENFPTTHLESLCCGTPVATYEAGGSAEMLTQACGAWVPVGDEAGLRSAILKAAACREEDCLTRGSEYSEQQRLDAYVSLYQTILSNQESGSSQTSFSEAHNE